APFSLVVTPGNTEVTKGDSLVMIAHASGATAPNMVTFELGVIGETRVRSQDVTVDSLGRFLYQENNLRLPFRYRAVSGSVTSDWYDVAVIDRPVLRNLQITLHPPSYSGLPTEELPPGTGNITALQGTEAHIRIRSSIPGTRAWLSLDSDSDDITLDDLAGTITIHDETSYRILLESSSGVRNLDPISYSVTPLYDRHPSIELISPAPQTDMDFELLVPLTIRVQDDFGFSRFTLSWRHSESRFGDTMDSFQEMELPLPTAPEIQYLWDLDLTTGLDIVPGDVISYFVTTWDNDGYNGPKKSSSVTQELRLPSITERYEALEAAQDETESGLESLLEETELIREEFDELRDELRRKQDASWDDRQNLEELRRAQEDLQNRVDELTSNMADAAQQMEDHDLVSDELLDLFEELQNVTEEINSPELMEALQELQEALSELDPAMMQESLEKFEFNEEMFRERIERALELFKNFQVQQQLEEAARRAEDLQQVQENLAEQTSNEDAQEDSEDLADEQLLASDEMTALEDKMEEISDRMQELQRAPTSQMEQLNEQTQAQELPENMRQNAQQMQSGRMQQANQGQQQMSQSMQQLQSDLQNIQSGMQGQQMQVNLAALKLILSNVLRLSQDQEELRRKIANATQGSPLLRDFAQEQSILGTGGAVVADSIQSLGRNLPQLSRNVQQFAGNAIFHMSATTEALTDRNSNAAESYAAQAMTSLNDLALLLSDLLDQLMNSSSSSGGGMSMEQMIQQLQQMAA
ncbi:MAG: chromosome partitioning protein ParA, partial [Bacteroidetes bacterium]|nr:chromosome partitioning protein ParA [Bacteroidota bacterium]